jgi:hypothetical protein
VPLRRDPETQNQYRAFNGERYVGRIYQTDKDHWFWAVAIDVTVPANKPYGWNEHSPPGGDLLITLTRRRECSGPE